MKDDHDRKSMHEHYIFLTVAQGKSEAPMYLRFPPLNRQGNDQLPAA
jgi:hypothetical protein